ncbi:DUF3786 domain-containing protein [Tepidibacter sp. Z1-5]|uniref:DUF3786 domain-containing protein n=1 Tax=Tepidibacter sp. Z1-5 TaxID=3134138 RepID=UPI0030C191F5
MDNRQGRVPYEYIRDIFQKTDPKKMARLTGNEYHEDNNTFILKIINKNYKVKYPSGDIYNENDERINSYIIKIMILRYLVNGQGISQTGKDITFKDINGGHVYYKNFYSRTILRLANIYGNNLKKFEQDFKNIECEKTNKGDLAYKFEFLKNVFFTFIIWEGDEEFDPSANVLFDSNIEYYFNAEDLAVVVDIAITFIKNRGKLPLDLGMYK